MTIASPFMIEETGVYFFSSFTENICILHHALFFVIQRIN